MPDAVVIGSGPNGLVAANLLADEGWDVVVCETQSLPGGAVRSSSLIEPGFTNDWMSAFYPLGAASPVIAGLGLENHGLRWRRAEVAVAHPASDGTCAALSTDLAETEASLDAFAPGDGAAWRELYQRWTRVEQGLLGALLSPFPPVKAAGRLALSLRPAELLRFARFALLPVRRLGEEHFRGEGGRRLLAANALHADLFPESTLSGMFGWLLVSLGQHVGFPVPEGGAGNLSQAMIRRFEQGGGLVRTNARVAAVIVRGGRAVGVRLEDGTEIDARRAVVADTLATTLFTELVGLDLLPAAYVRDLRHFQLDTATVKVDWTLDGPIPWHHEAARRAGTVHLVESVDELTRIAAQLTLGVLPADPFLLVGQYSMFDPTRAPAGKEAAWAYTRIPQEVRGDEADQLSGRWDDGEVERFADRMEARIERNAPGFRDRIRGRHIFGPKGLEAADENLVGGAINGGTAQLHQQLVFRPVPNLARAETPVAGLYLGSASAHPGGGVHGGPGANAARAAIWHDRVGRARRVLAPGD